MARRSGWIAVAFVATLVLSVGTASGGRGPGSKLSKADRAKIAVDRAKGDDSVTLLLDAAPGQVSALAGAVESLGGTLRYGDDELGYARVDVSPERADAVASLPGVQGAGLDQVIPLAAEPDSSTPAENPFLPTQDIGAPQFVAANPTYDGRGVTIGILDSGVDPTRPELQTAYDEKGRTVPKVVDWVAATDPETDDDGSWVRLDEDVVAKGRDASFSVDGAAYTAAKPGRYGFGIFREDALCPDANTGSCEMHNDVNRDGDSSDAFGVLVARGGHNSRIWVDTDQDGSFADQKELREYRSRHDLDFFGDAADDTRRVPFVVQVERDGRDRYVNIGIVSGGHGTHVAGIAAGNGFFGGAMNGVAPGARIASARACRWPSGCPAHALIEGMIYLAKDAKADVINLSAGSLPLLNDGNTPRCDLYSRLSEQTGAQIVVAAGNNGPGAGTINDPATCDDVLSVGAYQSVASWSALFGADVADDTFWFFSSRGPRDDGGLAPTLSAPGGAISTWPGWEPRLVDFPWVPVPPSGYSRQRGTSMAAPEVSGAAALLVSAAEQERVKASPAQLRRALVSGARFLPGYGPETQGNGLVQVAAAWEVLRQGIRPVDIDSSARVATTLSDHLETPGSGPGLLVREGWDAGEGGSETITFVRNDGSGTYDVRWLGDAAFSSASSIALQKGSPAALTVDVAPLQQGVHSAIVQLDDPSTPGVEYETAATIFAAAVPAAPDWSASASGTVGRAGSHQALVVRVPEDAGQFRVEITAPGGRAKAHLISPDGVEATASGFAGTSAIATVADPEAGTWEVDVEATQAPPSFGGPSSSDYTVTATIRGAKVTPESVSALPQDFEVESLFAPLTARSVGGTPFASARAESPAIMDGETQTYDVQVPEGATKLTARIGSATEPSSDLDLLLFDCTSGECVQAGKSAGGTSEESVSVTAPAAGHWQVAVVGAFVPAGSTGYEYLDSWASPDLGSVVVTPVSATPWVVHAEASSTGDPGEGRFLQGFVQVSDGAAVVGTAEIDLP